jgi:hypothetical protein
MAVRAWTLTEVNEDKLKIFGRKILRKIYGPSYVNGVWRINIMMNCINYSKNKYSSVNKNKRTKLARKNI